MVSISFGKSNFSEIQNSYQMTVALVMMFAVLCSISSIVVSVKTSSSQEPVPIKREVAVVVPEDVAVVPEDVMTGGDDEAVPDEDETSLETGPADDEVEDETVNEDGTVEGYMLKK